MDGFFGLRKAPLHPGCLPCPAALPCPLHLHAPDNVAPAAAPDRPKRRCLAPALCTVDCSTARTAKAEETGLDTRNFDPRPSTLHPRVPQPAEREHPVGARLWRRLVCVSSRRASLLACAASDALLGSARPTLVVAAHPLRAAQPPGAHLLPHTLQRSNPHRPPPLLTLSPRLRTSDALLPAPCLPQSLPGADAHTPVSGPRHSPWALHARRHTALRLERSATSPALAALALLLTPHSLTLPTRMLRAQQPLVLTRALLPSSSSGSIPTPA